ncbi:MAG TPA: cyclase family protein [Streptosporangiaceae bacterium]|nr:cyclase family protein [Streptosporangiaceae bacterium]
MDDAGTTAGRTPRTRAELPRYDELPMAGRGGRSGWGLFGPGDCLGMMNLQTSASVLAAKELIKKGAVFSLNAEIDAVDPPLDPDRATVRHRVLHEPGPGFTDLDDVLDNFFPQGSSQWDSLAHAAYTPGVFYNGASDDDVLVRHRNTIDHWARRGIVGRGVLLDVERTLGSSYTPEGSTAFSTADLERARTRAGIEFSPGCIVLMRTGFLGWYRGQSWRARKRIAAGLHAPGIEHTEDMARYLWDNQIMAIASDTFAVEVWPPALADDDAPFGYLHRILIAQFGMALGELWHLDDLAADCDRDGICEFFLSSAPLNMPGGIGSPPNALAIK